MLGKLLKYELHATARSFLPIYALIIVASAINSIFMSFEFAEGTLGATLVLFALMITLAVITIMLVVVRFYKNLMGDEGYLMNTLPVNADALIWSKLIAVIIWCIFSTIVAVLSAFIMLLSVQTGGNLFAIISRGFLYISQLISGLDAGSAIFIILFILLFIADIIAGIFQWYFSISITQLAPFQKHRIRAAIVCFVLINVATSILNKLILSGDSSSDYLNDAAIVNINSGSLSINPSVIWHDVNLWLLFSLVITIILGGAFYFGTRYILNHKLNLE